MSGKAVKKKLLVFSHACVTAVNQSFYSDLMAETDWTVSLVIPNRWQTEYAMRDGSARWPEFTGTIHQLGVFLPGDIPRHVYRSWLVSLIKAEAPDAIYVHHEPYGFATIQIYLANSLAGNRPIGFYAAQNIEKHYPPPISQLERWVLGRSSFAFPVTKSALDVLRAKGYRHRAEVMPLALNTELYRPMPEWCATERARMGLGPERVVVGYMGRLVEEKGLNLLLEALERMPELPWELVFVGNGPMQEALAARAAQSLVLQGRVHFAGYVVHEDAPKWLSLFDILVLPSESRPNWKEQFGRVLVEAVACGTPVIGSDSGEIPNVIADLGGGLVFPEGDVAGFAEAIGRLVESAELRREFAEAGRTAVIERYSQPALARQFAGVIEEVVPRKNSFAGEAR